MKKIKYFYNTNTLRYEKLVTPLRVLLLRVFAFFSVLLVSSALVIWVYTKFIPKPSDKESNLRLEMMKDNYSILSDKVKALQEQMAGLEKRDNEVYRSIFEATPIPDSARVKEMLAKNEIRLIQSLSNTALIENMRNQLNNLSLRMSFQEKSFAEITTMVKNKEKLLRAIPAIQPVSNKNMKRVASGFGYRIDPVYKDFRLHAGLDFSAPTGTPIYATSDGVVQIAGFNTDGYGNKVVINHGYGFQTLYAHMIRIKARVGQSVKRGEVIGYVGSTGKSTGSHLHYEVIKRGAKVDPVYYFFNDLTPAQFDRLLKEAAANKQSLD